MSAAAGWGEGAPGTGPRRGSGWRRRGRDGCRKSESIVSLKAGHPSDLLSIQGKLIVSSSIAAAFDHADGCEGCASLSLPWCDGIQIDGRSKGLKTLLEAESENALVTRLPKALDPRAPNMSIQLLAL